MAGHRRSKVSFWRAFWATQMGATAGRAELTVRRLLSNNLYPGEQPVAFENKRPRWCADRAAEKVADDVHARKRRGMTLNLKINACIVAGAPPRQNFRPFKLLQECLSLRQTVL